MQPFAVRGSSAYGQLLIDCSSATSDYLHTKLAPLSYCVSKFEFNETLFDVYSEVNNAQIGFESSRKDSSEQSIGNVSGLISNNDYRTTCTGWHLIK